MAYIHKSRSVPNLQSLSDEDSPKLNRGSKNGQETEDLDSVSSGNSTSRWPISALIYTRIMHVHLGGLSVAQRGRCTAVMTSAKPLVQSEDFSGIYVHRAKEIGGDSVRRGLRDLEGEQPNGKGWTHSPLDLRKGHATSALFLHTTETFSLLSHLKSSPTSRSAASLLSPSATKYHGSDQYLHIPKDMKNKPVKNEKLKSQRNLSVSTPVMPPSRSLTPDIGEKLTPHSSKSRNKKFHRIFKQVPPDERVVNFFSCALLADILLQGHLYITENYFGFYSNVFGHVTKILIPVTAVLKITKEKTAKFIPNAVGIVTEDDKHIFGSLLSRETTFRLMYKVWLRRINPDPGVRDDSEVEITPGIVADDEDEDEGDEDDSGSGGELHVGGGGRTSSESAVPSAADNDSAAELGSCPPSPENTSPSIQELVSEANLARKKRRSGSPEGPTSALHTDNQPRVIQSCFQKMYGIVPVDKMQGGARNLVLKLVSLPRCTLLLLVSTLLLLFLFLSAAMLIYRLNVLQQKMGSLDVWETDTDFKVQLFQEVFKWQRQLHDGCINHVQSSLDSRIQQLGQVRRSLRTLLLLLVPDMPQTDFNNKNSQTNS